LKKSSLILGISCFYHDSAAALIDNGQVVAAAQEERFSRVKNDASFPKQAIEFCLHDQKITLDDLDGIVFYDKPLLTFERILENHYRFAPKGLFAFIKAMPSWLGEKLFLKSTLKKSLNAVDDSWSKTTPIFYSEHHLSHAASTFYPSPFDEAAIIVLDGVGEWATTSIMHGRNGKIEKIEELHFPHSLGLLYSSFTYFLGFKVNKGEYKLMGLAPFASRKDPEVLRFVRLIQQEVISGQEDGSYTLNLGYFRFPYGLTMLQQRRWEKLFGVKRRQQNDSISHAHCQLALAIQMVVEAQIQQIVDRACALTSCNKVCLAGGVALNCVSNGLLTKKYPERSFYIQPAAGDAGGALGAALALHAMHFGNTVCGEAMATAFLGPSYSNQAVRRSIERSKYDYRHLKDDELIDFLVQKLEEKHVIGLFRGRMEFGPRALGNRSILADPREASMQDFVNQKIKFRESFRPFAPILLQEEAEKYFETICDSPYMLQVDWLKEKYRIPPTTDSYAGLTDRLQDERSPFSAVSHIDYSSRLQTINEESDPFMQQLLMAWKQKTGIGMLINTSFNRKDEPIVCSPSDAIQCFKHTEMDVLVLNSIVIEKKNA
jgi:carbamoyltransferase